MLNKINKLLNNIKVENPIIHHITNYVTVNDCANITLAIGASPIMADDISEVSDIVSISKAFVINIGTLNTRTIDSIITAGKKANQLNIPVIFDPVGVGASKFRNDTTEKILNELKINVIRGNISEIAFIAGLDATTKGVDASDNDMYSSLQFYINTAKYLATKKNCVVAVTGPNDIISDGVKTVCIENGHEMLSKVTGTGCMCSSLIGSFCGVTKDYLSAASGGILCMGIAGEIAFENNNGTGSFHISVIDEISKLNSDVLNRRTKLYEV